MSKEFERCAIPFIAGTLQANLALAPEPKGVVLLEAGSHSMLEEPDEQGTPNAFLDSGFSTLTVDLLTPEERSLDEGGGRFSYNFELLSERIGDALRYIRAGSRLGGGVAIFAEGVGAAAALLAAFRKGYDVRAVASWRGRADLIEEKLPLIEVPTLFMASRFDHQMLMSNAQAWSAIGSADKLLKAIETAPTEDETDAATRLAAHWLSANWDAWRHANIPLVEMR